MSTLEVKAIQAPSGYDLQMPAGHIIQVVQGTYATEVSNNASSYTDTGLTATITPSSSSNKILIIVNAPGCGCPNGSNASSHGRYRLASVISSTTTALIVITPQAGYTESSSADYTTVSSSYLHSPGVTSACIYKLQFQTGGTGTQKFLDDNAAGEQPTGTITLMEVAG
jgi:hypothetical protein